VLCPGVLLKNPPIKAGFHWAGCRLVPRNVPTPTLERDKDDSTAAAVDVLKFSPSDEFGLLVVIS
jgi:hypothetical protein